MLETKESNKDQRNLPSNVFFRGFSSVYSDDFF